jgi:hypothetical protein
MDDHPGQGRAERGLLELSHQILKLTKEVHAVAVPDVTAPKRDSDPASWHCGCLIEARSVGAKPKTSGDYIKELVA